MREEEIKQLKKTKSAIDVGEWAKFYASGPYGHFKQEVYALFIDILGLLEDRARVLDVGAGPGNLTFEYFKRFPRRKTIWTLIDGSRKLLEIALERLSRRRDLLTTKVRDLNAPDWDKGLGKFDAVVSNNALFCVKPERLDGFYAGCFARLKRNGLLLNQQTFAWEEGGNPYGDSLFARTVQSLPCEIMPKIPGMSESQRRKLERERAKARERHAKALEEAKARGEYEDDPSASYHWLTTERHMKSLRKAGFVAGEMWRKREFAVLMGVKGRPFGG